LKINDDLIDYVDISDDASNERWWWLWHQILPPYIICEEISMHIMKKYHQYQVYYMTILVLFYGKQYSYKMIVCTKNKNLLFIGILLALKLCVAILVMP